MALRTTYMISQLKEILPIDNINAYDNQLNILISGAIAKLENEGVPNIFNEDTNEGYNYIVCLGYQVAKDMDFEIDMNRLEEQYITRVNGLRSKISASQNNS